MQINKYHIKSKYRKPQGRYPQQQPQQPLYMQQQSYQQHHNYPYQQQRPLQPQYQYQHPQQQQQSNQQRQQYQHPQQQRQHSQSYNNPPEHRGRVLFPTHILPFQPATPIIASLPPPPGFFPPSRPFSYATEKQETVHRREKSAVAAEPVAVVPVVATHEKEQNAEEIPSVSTLTAAKEEELLEAESQAPPACPTFLNANLNEPIEEEITEEELHPTLLKEEGSKEEELVEAESQLSSAEEEMDHANDESDQVEVDMGVEAMVPPPPSSKELSQRKQPRKSQKKKKQKRGLLIKSNSKQLSLTQLVAPKGAAINCGIFAAPILKGASEFMTERLRSIVVNVSVIALLFFSLFGFIY